jgi:Uma2 family endonuclease
MAAMEALEEPVLKHYRLTVEQYHRMAEAGVLDEDSRVELIEGELIDRAPIGSGHGSRVARLNRLFMQAVGERAIVWVQSSIRLDEYSEPQPDLVLLKPRDDFYAAALPTARDVLLVVEVAESSAAYDLRTKARLYATHGVPAYWVVDLPAATLHRFVGPDGERYRETIASTAPGALPLPGLDGCSVDLSGLFGPAAA